jgi:hypothetical protein
MTAILSHGDKGIVTMIEINSTERPRVPNRFAEQSHLFFHESEINFYCDYINIVLTYTQFRFYCYTGGKGEGKKIRRQ